MDFQELVTLYEKMKENGVVIYGAGNEGKLAIDVLHNEKIEELARNGKVL